MKGLILEYKVDLISIFVRNCTLQEQITQYHQLFKNYIKFPTLHKYCSFHEGFKKLFECNVNNGGRNHLRKKYFKI